MRLCEAFLKFQRGLSSSAYCTHYLPAIVGFDSALGHSAWQMVAWVVRSLPCLVLHCLHGNPFAKFPASRGRPSRQGKREWERSLLAPGPQESRLSLYSSVLLCVSPFTVFRLFFFLKEKDLGLEWSLSDC